MLHSVKRFFVSKATFDPNIEKLDELDSVLSRMGSGRTKLTKDKLKYGTFDFTWLDRLTDVEYREFYGAWMAVTQVWRRDLDTINATQLPAKARELRLAENSRRLYSDWAKLKYDAQARAAADRKSTRLNSSHVSESRMPSSA